MAELGRREEVNDPLALNPREKGADRSLATYGVRNPMQSGGGGLKDAMSILGALDGIKATVSRAFEQEQDNAIVNGKIAHMRGESEASLGDNKYSKQGWQSMEANTQANNFMTEELEYINNGDGQQLDPKDYQQRLQSRYNDYLKNIPGDPAAKKMWAASFADIGPRLMATQVEKNNEYNGSRGTAELTNMLLTGAPIKTDASVGTPEVGFRVNQEPVRDAITYTPEEEDLAVRTLLSEAGGEGDAGMAAVAQVFMNRMGSGSYPNTLSGVITQDKQFEGVKNNGKWDPDSTAYKKALAVFRATASGHVVDQTGGALNFYAPDKVTPYWAGEESSAKDVQIGNHKYLGHEQASKGSVVTDNGEGGLKFVHKGQEGIRDDLRTMLENTSAAMGAQLKITSGYRSPEHNASVGGAKESQHTHGNAVDIDMAGMSDEARYNLVQSLRANGAKRFITYSKSPNMLHVDNSDAQGANWFMFDKSNANLGNAPAWFKQASTAEPPQPGEVPQTKRTGSQIQRILQSSSLRGNQKAEALTTAIVRTLDSGDDGLMNDSGGVSTLLGLGATREQIDKVYAAQKRFDEKKDKEFDLDYEKGRADVLSRVSNGEFQTVDEALDAVDIFHKKFGGTDSQAQSLSRAVANEWDKGRENSIVPLEVRTQAAKLKANLDLGIVTAEEAGQGMIDMGKKYGLKASVINNFVSDMYSREQSNNDSLKSEAATEFKKKQAEAQTINQATNAITKGSGLKGLGGKVSIPDTTPGNEGKTKEVTGEEYGIWALKKSAQDDINRAVARGEISKEQGQVEYYNTIYENLSKQGVVDKEFGRQIGASVTGDIIDPKTKEVREEALAALDVYMQMRNNPKVGDAYAASMIEDPEARTLLEYASSLYNGQYNPSMALQAASARLNNKLDPPAELEKTVVYNKKVQSELTGAVNALTSRGGWTEKLMAPFTSSFTAEQVADLQKDNASLLGAYMYQQANTYFNMNKNVPVDVAVKQAKQDLERNAVAIGGSIVIGNEQQGTRLDQVMGLQGYGKEGPHEALMSYLQDFAGNKEAWGQLWEDRKGGLGLRSFAEAGVQAGTPIKRTPEIGVTFNPMSQTLEVVLYKDSTRTETVGNPMNLDAKTLGERYKKKAEIGAASGFQKSWRDYVVDPVTDKRQEYRNNKNASDLGATIGGMINK